MSPVVVTSIAHAGLVVIVVSRAVAGGEGIPKKGHHGNLSVVGWWIRAGLVCGREIETQGCRHDEQQNALLESRFLHDFLLSYPKVMVRARLVSGCCSQRMIAVDTKRVIPPSLLPLVAARVVLDPMRSSSRQPFCVAVAKIRSCASSRGIVMLKQRVMATGDGLGPSSSLSLKPRKSMPSQVAEVMGSLRMRSRYLACAEQPVRSSQAHRTRAVAVVVTRWCIIASRVGC